MKVHTALSGFALMSAGLVPISAAAGQQQSVEAEAQLSERMAPLGVMVGEWSGNGWMIGPDGVRSEFNSHEIVTPRLSGAALLVEGQHRLNDETHALIHDAMAMITWDAVAEEYRFRTALATGHGGNFPLALTESGFDWSMDTPGGRIDYRVNFTETSWDEAGRFTGSDGESAQFFEMTLQRQ